MFNIKENGLPFKARLAGCTEARKASPAPAPLLFIILEVHARTRWVTHPASEGRTVTACKSVDGPCQGGGERCWWQGPHSALCMGAPTHPESVLKDGKVPDKDVGYFWVEDVFPLSVIPICSMGIIES